MQSGNEKRNKKESRMKLEEKLEYYKGLSIEERLAKLEEKIELLTARVEVCELTDERVTDAFKQIKKLQQTLRDLTESL